MSNLIVISYPDEATAAQAATKLESLRKRYLIDLEDVAYVTKDDKGAVHLTQSRPLAAVGAASGSLWGLLIGTLFLIPIAGAAIGAATGALAGKTADIGINDDMMKQIGANLKDARSALFVLVRSATVEKVLPEMQELGGKVVQTSLQKDAEEKLRAAIEGKEAYERMASQVAAQHEAASGEQGVA